MASAVAEPGRIVPTAEEQAEERRKFRYRAGAFLAAVGATSAVAGFSKAIMSAKKSDPKYFDKGLHGSLALHEAGTSLALRALGWGTLYAILGTGTICFGIWKLSGAKNMEEFRQAVGSAFPRVPRNDPPTSRTEFEGLTDLMQYLSTWGKEEKAVTSLATTQPSQ
ncbi:transmembrane protein 242 [Anopheles arabiensis]|uniref:Transmembrane protein 242 n=4 Tax=gambiae species complex TaxID=44542 RepID=A0A6E8VYV3_ANOCL|nr:transmembrane protein 242 [Anopheles arabiensis]XP_061510820.1 transmembrane protein 242 isoform X2 [Anopheles gambiae]XP_061510821.1 transmembrane protein 242 isoform X2 [Anopheles gambiae]